MYHWPVDFIIFLPIALAALWIARARQRMVNSS
jgi:membrane protein implicated in regulation of membrane protease activity